MSFKKIQYSNSGKTIVFDFVNSDVAYANTLRRIILSEIPNIAIAYDPYNPQESDINFRKNTSVLHNEFVGRRISLLPMHLSKSEIESFDPNNYRFKISKHNTTDKIIDVTTDDIVLISDNDEQVRNIFPHDSITNDPIIITKLKPNEANRQEGEAIEVEFTARRGIAKQHARWCPVSTCTYFNILDDDQVNIARKQLSDKDLHTFETIGKMRLFKKNKYDEANAFRFTIESECKLTASEIVDTAFDVIIKKLQTFQGDNKFDVSKIINDQMMITIHNEDHTIGNMLTTYIYNKYVRELNEIDFVAYYQPHPLENDIIMKLKPKSSFDINMCRSFIIRTVQELSIEFKKLQEEFKNMK